MYRIIAAVAAVLCCAPSVQAETEDAAPLFTLQKALALANASSPTLDGAAAGLRSAEAARDAADLLPNPTVIAQSQYFGGTGEYRGLRGSETTAGLAMPIELGGKRSARVAAAESRRRKASIEAAIASADLRLKVVSAYVAAAAAEQRLALAREQSRVANGTLAAAQARVTSGAGSPIERQRADVLRVNADVAKARAVRDAAAARENLARQLGQPVGGSFDQAWFGRVDERSDPVPSVEDTLALAVVSADVSVAEAQVKVADSQRTPDITVTAGVIRLAATTDTAAMVGVSIPLPVFNDGSAALRQAHADRNQAEARRRASLMEAEQQITLARADYANAAEAARAAGGPALAAAAEAARIARIGYAQGKFGQLELLDAEKTLAETKASHVDALAAWHEAKARLDRLTAPAFEQGSP